MLAYIVTARNTSKGWLTLKQVDIVPPGTPAILRIPKMNGIESVTFGIPSTTLTADDVSDNMLLASTGEGVTVPTVNDGYTYFALACKTQGVGFYKVHEGVTIPAKRAYLKILNSQVSGNAREFLGFDDGSNKTTEIVNITTTEPMESAIYDMLGHRVQKTLSGHLYIKNGKKIIAQ